MSGVTRQGVPQALRALVKVIDASSEQEQEPAAAWQP
jgi:hypothetical protein